MEMKTKKVVKKKRLFENLDKALRFAKEKGGFVENAGEVETFEFPQSEGKHRVFWYERVE